jgi:hypothetical protein
LNLQIDGIHLRESTVGAVNDTLSGYGEIASINDTNQADFCNGCSLTFTFQYTVKDITGNQIVFDNGSLNMYMDSTGSFKETNPDSAGIGDLWLSATGHTASYQDYATTGQLFSNLTGTDVSQPGDQSGGFGLLDVTGGAAKGEIKPGIYGDGLGGFADLKLTSSFAYNPAGIEGADGTYYPISGTGHLLNKQMAVPEPAELGLFGLGLGALGVFFWRRRKEADNAA